MTTNYDASQVGVPYVRVDNITINYSESGVPTVGLSQALAIKGADGTVYKIGDLPPIRSVLDLVADGTTPVPLVNPEDGSALGADTNLQQVFLGILAVVRKIQLDQPE